MEKLTLGDQIREARKVQNLNQSDLAYKCKLNVRTIQRIESGEVNPRMYTLRIINEALKTNFSNLSKTTDSTEEINHLRKKFELRRIIRISLAVFAIVFLIAVGLRALNDWELFGMSKRVWAPFVYVIMFAIIGGIAIVWRCPGCNAILGDISNTRYCSKCGLHLKKE